MTVLAPLVNLARRLAGQPVKDAGPVTPGLARLGRLLDAPPGELLQFRRARRDPRYHYHPLTRAKPTGATRQIYAPSPALKALQRALLREYLDTLPLHWAATGFRRGYSVANNARRHLGQAVVAAADITDFFDHTGAQRVRDFFAAQGWDEVAVSVLTGLCTFRDALPQGAPTSPVLSNLVNVPLDDALAALARQSNARYSRYGDDLTFSWADPRRVPPTMQRDVQRILLGFEYPLNQAKGWRVWRVHRGEVATVAGVALTRDGQMHPTPEVAAAMRALRHPQNEEEEARLRGYEGFVKMLR